MIDISYYFLLSGFLVTLISSVLLVVILSWKAGFKDFEKFFTKEYVNSEYKNIKRVIFLGFALFLTGFLIFIAGKIMGQY